MPLKTESEATSLKSDFAKERLRYPQKQIAHAYRLRALLDLAAMPIAVATTNAPGDIVFRDAHQIVAIPQRDNPVRFVM